MWRAEMPARHLGAKFILVQDSEGACYTTPNDDGPFRWHETEEGAVYPDVEGTVVWTRPCMLRAIHGAAMSANGSRVICEVDDNYLSEKKHNIFMRLSDYTPEKRRDHMQAFASFDAIICSTEELRDMYAKTFKKELGLDLNLYVARNHIDPETWADRKPMINPERGSRLRVGWAGSDQHVWDLRLAAPALHLAKEMGCEIVLIGLDPARHDPKWKEFLGEYTHVPWVDPSEYHNSYINIDIGLIPLVYNKHTLGKSDIKFLEYTMSGAASVAQNNSVYNKTVQHGETGFLAGSPDEMAILMAKLIKDRRLREEMVANAREYVLANRTIQGNLHEWSDAIEGR